MNDQDKPIGAPNLHTDAPHDEQSQTPQQPEKQKRKLNWKGFGIGIIAVIIIEFFAVSMLNSPDPEIPIAPPNEPTKAQPSPTMDPTADWQTYTSSKSAYTFKYPKAWTAELLAPSMLTLNDKNKDTNIVTIVEQSMDTPLLEGEFETNARRDVTKRNIKVDNISGIEYTQTYIAPKNSGIKPGHVVTYVVIERNDKRFVLHLEDRSQKQTFNQILSTFKFTDTTSSDGMYTVSEAWLGEYNTIKVLDKAGNIITNDLIKDNEDAIETGTKIRCQCDITFKEWRNNTTFAIRITNAIDEEYEYQVDAKTAKVNKATFKQIKAN
jgi:hypothetical protein